ncbi:MAG: anthranilate synthase component I family protein [Polyangiaceae bacterium]|nr:anthranilate synthase component I family protein [Polyangiaceae bacterium]
MSQILTRTFAADHVTPVRAYAALRAQSPGRSSFLLESALPGERWGRYSIIGYRARSEHAYPPGSHALSMLADDVATLENAEELAARLSQSLVGYIAYDAAHAANSIKPWPTEGLRARLMCDSTVAVFDHLTQTVTIAGRSKGAVERCAWEMTHGPELDALPAPDASALPESVETNLNDDAYGMKVQRAKGYIADGDCLQIVLARTFTVPMKDADAFDVYRALRVLSPSPYLCFFDFAETPFAEGFQIASASPETLVRVSGRKVTIRPIAGTRKRGATEAEDEALAQELLADPKERAEHVMLVDLARNDIGRVAKPGSVRVVKDMVVEKFSHVMHIVSEVEGELAETNSPIDALGAAFPAGTLSGAPKVRAMQIIRQLEAGSRGVYGGGLGYIAPDGTVDLAIAIRTVVARQGEFEVTAGAGVVIGSEPEREAEETRNKARAALAAIRSAHDAVERRAAREEAKRKKAEEEERKKAEAAGNAGNAEGVKAEPTE